MLKKNLLTRPAIRCIVLITEYRCNILFHVSRLLADLYVSEYIIIPRIDTRAINMVQIK